MPNTIYRVKGEEPEVKEVECKQVPQANGDLLFKVGSVSIQVLQSDGTLYRYKIHPALAAELGLQLDEKGRVKCVD